MRRKAAVAVSVTCVCAATALVLFAPRASTTVRAAADSPKVAQELLDRAQQTGRARAIVELKLPAPYVPEAALQNQAAVRAQRQAIEDRRARILSRLPAAAFRVAHQYQTIPYVSLELSPAALAALASLDADVVRVMSDPIVRPGLAQSVPLIQGDQVWDVGYDGSGSVIAVIDSGVDRTHPFIAGKMLDEACFSSTVDGTSQTFCPNGLDEQFGPGAAAPCPLADCIHGTHVAGIAAGNGAAAGVPFSGVAKGAQLIAVQVFSRIIDPTSCGGIAPCVGAFTSDIIAGMEWVYGLAGQRNVVAVNMSLGGGDFTAPCDDQPYKPPIDNLRSLGIATVVASGNNGSFWSLVTPACVSTAVSVGSTNKSDAISWFSNVSSFLSLLAPGESITSSVPGGSYTVLSGTSMAAPHVAGAWGVLKQAVPGASVDTILGALRQTGKPVTDTRFLGTETVPRIRVFDALASLVPVTSPPPVSTALSPARVRANSSPLTLTVTGSRFNGLSVIQWNGSARPTTVVDSGTLEATIPASDLAATGSAQVTVFTPAPGGGTSAALTLFIDPPATLTPNVTAIAPGGTVTVALANGYGGASDWIALAAVGAPDNTYLKWTYVGSGMTTRTWSVAMPTTPGSYEFRLFLNNGFTRAATSAAVTVDASLNPPPVASSLSPNVAVAGGPAFSLQVNGSGFIASSVVTWNGSNRPTTYVSASQLRADIGAADIATVGTAQIAVSTPAPGGGTSAGLPFTISPPPSLAVSATTVPPGGSVTVSLTSGLGGGTDWLALASTSSANTSYLQYTYVGAGVTTRTWTVTMPSTTGAYEFRLFLNNGFTRAATSPTVYVQTAPNPVPAITSLSPASATMGGPAFTLTVNGSGFVNGSVVRWNGTDRPTTYVSSAQLRASIGAADLSVGGTAQVTVFSPAPGGGTSGALAFTISSSTPTLTVSATEVGPGSSVTMTLTDGSGGATDWLALAATSAPNSTYLQYVYVGAGVTTRTWTVTMPAALGTYEFRLFLNNGFTRAATSPTVTVSAINPVPAVTSLSPAGAMVGSAGFTLTVNGSGFISTSVVRWNGTDRPTTFVNSTRLQAAIPAADLATGGTAQITVFTPSPGGGTSSPQPFAVATSPPALSVDASTVVGGNTVTVTLTNGFGGSTDWLAFATSSAPNSSYVQYVYVGAGVTTRTWTVTTPIAGGTYEFRLFLNNGYTRAATSPAITVTPGPNPAPVLGSLSPTTAAAGMASFTFLVNGSGFAPSSVVRWNGADRPTTFVSSTQLQASLSASDLSAPGTFQVAVFSPSPGGGLSASLPFTVAPTPALAVSATSVAPGAQVTVTLTGGLGGSTDWLAFAASTAPNTSYVQYVYVGAGVTTRSWTVAAPTTPGSYEFRLFLNNGYLRAATSPAVTVQ